MTLNSIKFSFTKDHGFRSLSLKEAMQGSARISLPSDQIATTGITCIFQKLRTVNERIYQDAMSMDDFTVTLFPQGPKNLGLKIESKKVCINLQKLKPETSAILTNALNPLQRDLLFNTGVVRAEPQETHTLLIPFMFMLSVFRNMLTFLSSCISRPSKSAELKLPVTVVEPPCLQAEKLSEEVLAPQIQSEDDSSDDSDEEIEYFDAPGEPARLYFDASSDILPVEDNKNSVVAEKIDLPSPAVASDDAGLEVVGKDKEEIIEKSFEMLASNVIGEKKLTPAPTEYVIASANTGLGKEEVMNTSRTETESLNIRFICHYPLTPITNPNTEDGLLFGAYLRNRILGKADSCHFNQDTGDFTLTFAEEQKIVLKDLPSNLSEGGSKKLQIAKDKTLHVAKNVKGNINPDGGISFMEGSLTIQGTKFWVPFTAHLLEIKTNSQYPNYLDFIGKMAGITKTECLLAQDFVNLVEANFPKK